MSHEYFYHYTTKDAARRIVLSGKIKPSPASNGDAGHGDGVYLTSLEPVLGKKTVGKNSWDGITRHPGDKMERYFEILIPNAMVRSAESNIHVYTFGQNPWLNLADYKWRLKNTEGEPDKEKREERV